MPIFFTTCLQRCSVTCPICLLLDGLGTGAGLLQQIKPEQGSGGDALAGPLSDDPGEHIRGKTGSRALERYQIFGQNCACRNIARRYEALSDRGSDSRFAFRRPLFPCPQGRFHLANCFHHAMQVGRCERGPMIRLGQSLSSVKCFSMTEAPSAAAARATSIPSV